jgi:hypothetical protein
MPKRRRILFAGLALALPVTGFAVFGTPSMFAGAAAPTDPVACNVAGTVTFTPALTETGTHTTNKAALTTVTITGGRLAGCLSPAFDEAPGHGDFPPAPATTVSFTIPATKLARGSYATGYCPAFDGTTTLKALKGLKLDVAWTNGAGGTSDLTTTKATLATNMQSEVGFALSVKQSLGPYAEKSIDQFTLFIDQADSTILSSHCSGAQTVSSVTFDKGNSVAIF